MPQRNWTVVIVGDDTESPRTVPVSSRTLRAAKWMFGATLLGLVAASLATGMALRPRTLPTDPSAALALMQDSIRSLGRQTAALRVVAGLADSTAPSVDDGPVAVDTLIHRADRLSVELQQVAAKLHGDAEKVARTPSIMPTAGWLTSQFSLSRFHPILHKYLPHLGIDVAAPYGTTVVAPAAGTVIRVATASGYGLVLEIDHGNGIVTKYGHLSRFLVRMGQAVVRGQPIAAVGNSGLATGPHLHYEVHVNGTIVDPLTYVLPSAIPEAVHDTRGLTGAPDD